MNVMRMEKLTTLIVCVTPREVSYMDHDNDKTAVRFMFIYRPHVPT